MNTNIKQIKQSILPILQRYGVSKAALFGSIVKDQMQPDSDIDFLVLLDGQPREPEDSWTCINVLYPLVLEFGRPIHAEPVDVADYEAGEFSLYRNAAREGILL